MAPTNPTGREPECPLRGKMWFPEVPLRASAGAGTNLSGVHASPLESWKGARCIAYEDGPRTPRRRVPVMKECAKENAERTPRKAAGHHAPKLVTRLRWLPRSGPGLRRLLALCSSGSLATQGRGHSGYWECGSSQPPPPDSPAFSHRLPCSPRWHHMASWCRRPRGPELGP